MTLKALAASAAACLLATQQQAPPTFRSEVSTVHVDVSVLDRDRRPVRGLRPAAFTILEDGKPQEISVFQAVDIPHDVAPSAAWMREIAPDVTSNEGLQERRLFLIVMDDATLQGDQRAVTNARGVAQHVVERLGPSDLAAVIFTRDNRNAQDYTADRQRLLAAVNRIGPGFRDMGLFNAETGQVLSGEDDYYLMASADVLESAIQVLAKMPDRRKVVVYVGQGLPLDFGMLAPQQPGLPAGGGGSALLTQATMSKLVQRLQQVIERAARANVNVYTLDVCGLRSPPPTGSRRPPTCVPGLEVDYLMTVASNTGGRAVVNTDDFGPGVDAIFAENASYYLLGYKPATTKADGKLHRLEVRVDRRDVTVRTRNGYEADRASDVSKRNAALAASPLGAALSGVLPKTDLPMRVSAIAIPDGLRGESSVAIILGVRQPIRDTSGRNVRVDLQVSAFNLEGKPFGSQRLLANVTLRPDSGGLAEYEVLSQLRLRPGRYQLRLAAHVGSLATSGSIYCDVDVPDVTKATVSVTGLMFNAAPGLAIAPPDALKSIVPLVPTASRTFAQSSRVTTFARVFQSGQAPLRPLPVRVRITSDSGIVESDRQQELAADRFKAATRSADVVFDLPMARLAPGEHLLSVEIGRGQALVRRDARFHVQPADGR